MQELQKPYCTVRYEYASALLYRQYSETPQILQLVQETDAVVNGICRAAPEAFETHQKGKVEGPSGLSQPSIAAYQSKPLAHALGSVWGEGQLDEIEMCTSRGGASRFPSTVVEQQSATPLTSNVGEAR